MKLFSALASTAIMTLSVLAGCTKSLDNSQATAIANSSNTLAMGLLPVRRWVEEARVASDDKLTDGQLWAKNAMNNLEYFAFVGCSGANANLWFELVEEQAARGVLYVDEKGGIRYNETSAETPDLVRSCKIVNSRLVTYPVIESALNAATAKTPNEADYTIGQALFLGLRSSYGTSEAASQRVNLQLLPLARMRQSQEGSRVNAETLLKEFLAKDGEFVPDACGVTARGASAGAGSWKNKTFTCRRTPGKKADEWDFVPVADDFVRLQELVRSHIDHYYQGAEAPANERERLMNALTDVSTPIAAGWLKKDFGKAYASPVSTSLGQEGLDLRNASYSGARRPLFGRLSNCQPLTYAPPLVRPLPTGPRPQVPPPSTVPGRPPQTTPSGPSLGGAPNSALINALRPNAQGLNSGTNNGFSPNGQALVQQVANGNTTGLTTLNYPSGSQFSGVTNQQTGESLIRNGRTGETFLVHSGSIGGGARGDFIENAPHIGTDPTRPGFVGVINHATGPGISNATGTQSTSILRVGDAQHDIKVGMVGNDRDGYQYRCSDLNAAQTRIDEWQRTGQITQQQHQTASQDIAYMRQHSTCGGSARLALLEEPCTEGAPGQDGTNGGEGGTTDAGTTGGMDSSAGVDSTSGADATGGVDASGGTGTLGGADGVTGTDGMTGGDGNILDGNQGGTDGTLNGGSGGDDSTLFNGSQGGTDGSLNGGSGGDDSSLFNGNQGGTDGSLNGGSGGDDSSLTGG